MTGNKLAADQENLIRNGDFSKGEENWQLYSPPDGKAEILDGYCHASGGGMVSQGLELGPGQYRISFEGLFTHATESYLNLALEISGFRAQIYVTHGDKFIPYSFGFSVSKPSHGDVDFLSVMLNGLGAGGNFRNVKLVLVEA